MKSLARARPRPFYGWVIVFSAFVSQLISNGLGFQGFGTFLIPLQQEFGWSKTALSAARSFMQIESGIADPAVGYLVDRVGPRILTIIGTFIFGLGMVLFSFVHSLWAYYAVFLLMGVGGSLGGFLVSMVAVNNWFRRKRTLAMALSQMGLGIGGILVIPLLVWAQVAFGWRAAALSAGIAVWVIGIPFGLLLRHSPERYGLLPDGELPTKTPRVAIQAVEPVQQFTTDFTLREALHAPAFWFIGLGHGLSIMAVSAIAVHQFAHMQEGIGLSPGAAASVITVLSITNIAGRLVAGFVGDRYPLRYIAVLGLLCSASALVVLAFATTLFQAMIFGVLHGIGWGVRGPIMNSIRGAYFGRTSFGKISGLSSVITAPCAIVGPLFAGLMAAVLGNYQIGFVSLACVSAAGALFFFLARPPSRSTHVRDANTHPERISS